jgi:hypothetical protein
MPASAPQPTQPHAALIWLIRGTGVLIAGLSSYALVATICAMPKYVDHFMAQGAIWTVSGFCSGLLILLLEVGFVRFGYHMFRKVDVGGVAIFSLIFALLLAIVLHHFLPVNAPHALIHRSTLSFITFFLFYTLSNWYLIRILDLNQAQPPAKKATFRPENTIYPV